MPAPARPDPLDTSDALLTPAEVARLFRVDPKTVARWEKNGRLTSVRTLGGHRRYLKAQAEHVLKAGSEGTVVVQVLEVARTLATDAGDAWATERISDLIAVLRHRAQ